MPNITFRPGVTKTPHDVPRLFAEDYYSPRVAIKTYHVDYSDFTVPMYLNDQLGDCTCAGICHCAGSQSKYGVGTELLYSDSQVQSLYSGSCGYVPGDPDTDQGGTLQQVLAYAKANPNAIPGFELDAFAQLRNLTVAGLSTALFLYGSVYVAVDLPQSAEDQFNAGQPWTVSGDGTIAGGHCITLQAVTADQDNCLKWATWGAIQPSDETWAHMYVTEAWAVYSRAFLTPAGQAPNGLNEAALMADMASL
jgi:hypothetical protein